MRVIESASPQGKISFERAGEAGNLTIRVSGRWHLSRDLPAGALVIPELQKHARSKRLSYDTSSLTGWDSGLVSFLLEVEAICRQRGIKENR